MYEGRCPYCGGLLMFGGVKIDEVSAGFTWGFNVFSRRWLKWQSSESVEHSCKGRFGRGVEHVKGPVTHVLMRSDGEGIACNATYCPTCRKVFAEFKIADDGVTP